MIVEILIICIVTLVIAALLQQSKKQNLPPGPWSIPFFGRLPYMLLEDCDKDRQKYGDIFMRHFGNGRFLYIADYKLAKEAYNKIEFADRPQWEFLRFFEKEKLQGYTNGISMNNGIPWQLNRRFLLHHLRDLGLGKSKLEGVILKEVELLVDDFKTLTNSPSELPFSIHVSILNVIWQLVAGKRYDFYDAGVKDFMDAIHQAQGTFGSQVILQHFPFFKYILPEFMLCYLFKIDRFRTAAKKFESLVQYQIDDHKLKLDPENPADIIDEYLSEMNKEDDAKKFSHFNHLDLIRITLDLFVAGNETTASMTHWVLIYMTNYPSIQKKVQHLIDEFVPPERIPGLEQREQLGYLDAVINEVSRHCKFITFGIPRFTNTDLTFHGYFIPKGTVVSSVPGLSHGDPTYWKDPASFDPDRFLDENGKFSHSRDGFQPFGIGKRQCLGEQFARMELYLILAALLQKFTFSPPDGKDLDMTPNRIPIGNIPNRRLKFLIKER